MVGVVQQIPISTLRAFEECNNLAWKDGCLGVTFRF
jgi:hypothetical protein